MDRRRSLALILGLFCLALLGSWFVRVDREDASEVESPAATASSTPKLTSKIVQVPRAAPTNASSAAHQAQTGQGMFRGHVVDAVSREPVREFTVQFHPPRQAGHSEPPPPISRSFRSNDGRFDFRGLPAGTGSIVTIASGYQRFDIADVRIAENESAKVILIPMRAGHVLRGRVVDELTKEPIATALVSFREGSTGRYESSFRTRLSVRSGKDGSFVLEGVPPGSVRIEATALRYAGKEVEVFVSAKTPPAEVALSRGGTIAGYLAGADGLTPIEGQVSLSNLDENVTDVTATRSAGEFSFAQLTAGRYRLTGQGEGLNGEREIELSHNEQLEGVVLAMSPGHSIRGVVSGLRPNERVSTHVQVFADSRGGLTQPTRIDERGAYEVRGVAPGQIRIQASADTRGTVSQFVTMPADGDLTVNLEFRPGSRLSGRVTLAGKPLAGAMLHIHSRMFDQQNTLSLSPFVTSKNGEYAYEDVPDGEYLFSIESYSSAAVRVAGDTVFDMEIPDVQLSGLVFEEGGKVPVVGADIHLRPTQRRSYGNRLGGSSNNFGQFGIRGLQPGDFVLTAYKPGFELYRAPLSYGSPIDDMTIHMRRAPGVELKVRDADNNKAIASVTVVEFVDGVTSLVFETQADQNGVSHLPEGLAGSTLTLSAPGYRPIGVMDWNGQQLDLTMQRER